MLPSRLFLKSKKCQTKTLRKAIPANCNVPNDTQKPHFVAIDFGICQDENGNVIPQLIELQAFRVYSDFRSCLKKWSPKFILFWTNWKTHFRKMNTSKTETSYRWERKSRKCNSSGDLPWKTKNRDWFRSDWTISWNQNGFVWLKSKRKAKNCIMKMMENWFLSIEFTIVWFLMNWIR